MPSPYYRTMRSLKGERQTMARFLGIAAFLVLGTWVGWFWLGRLTVFASGTATLVVEEQPYTITAPLDGTVSENHLELGAQVAPGDLLLVLVHRPESLKMEETAKTLEGLETQKTELVKEIKANESRLGLELESAKLKWREAQAKVAEAESRFQLADEEYRRAEALFKTGSIDAVSVSRARSERSVQEQSLNSWRLSAERAKADVKAMGQQAKAALAKLQRDQEQLDSEATAARSRLDQWRHERERRFLRSPASGILGEVVPLQPGAFLAEGTSVATLVPSGKTRVRAYFKPADVLGKLPVGAQGRLRLDGFPWLQYGAISVRVTHVASAPRDGLVQVELTLTNKPKNIPLNHGLPGVVDLELERIAPVDFVLRTVGKQRATGGQEP